MCTVCGGTTPEEHRARGHAPGDNSSEQEKPVVDPSECWACRLVLDKGMPWVYTIGADGKRHRHALDSKGGQ